MARKKTRALRAALLCLMLSVLVSSCAPPPIPPPAPGTPPMEKPDTLEGVFRLMAGTGFLGGMTPVPDAMIAETYGIADAWMSEYVFMVAQDVNLADEIILIRAMDEASAELILSRLSARLAQKETAAMESSPEQYALILDARLIHHGRDLALIVSAEADQLVKLYEENRGG